MDEDSESAFDPAHIKYEIIEKVVKATFAEKGSPNPETGEAMYVEWSDSKRDSWVKDIIEGVLAKLAIFNEELSKQEGASVFKFVGAARPRPRPAPPLSGAQRTLGRVLKLPHPLLPHPPVRALSWLQ
tara:strand:- start:722 stop:1105 length:384 start_codon:yes stop_codon:yes gene_type:complete